jgi:hypothetical protein
MPLLSSSSVDPDFQLAMQLQSLVIGKRVSCKVSDRLETMDDSIAWFINQDLLFCS